MRFLPFALAFLFGCFPTSTGNPHDDLDAGGYSDASSDSARFDASALSDAAASDAASDSSSSDAAADAGSCSAIGCGREPALGCDCLAGDTLELVSLDPAVPQRAIAIADNGAGALLVHQQACESCAGGFRLDAIVIDEGDAITTAPIAEAGQMHIATARAGDSLHLVWLGADDALMGAALALADGSLAASAEPVHTPAVPIRALDLAINGDASALAYIGPASSEPLDGDAIYVVVPSDTDPVAVQVIAGPVRAMSIAAAADGWLLLYADDTAVLAQRLGPSGTPVGEPVSVGLSNAVERVELAAFGAGFVGAFDGTGAALHQLDDSGLSTNQAATAGSLEGLALDGDSVMLVVLQAAECGLEEPTLLYQRFDASLSALHAPIAVGAGERGAQAARIGEGHRVAVTRSIDAVSVLSLMDVCVAPPDA